jgi:WD40 repeat protein
MSSCNLVRGRRHFNIVSVSELCHNLDVKLQISDFKFVFLGSTDGRVHVWRTTDGEKLTTFTTDNSSDCIQCVQFNPKSFMLATASSNMVRIKSLIKTN